MAERTFTALAIIFVKKSVIIKTRETAKNVQSYTRIFIYTMIKASTRIRIFLKSYICYTIPPSIHTKPINPLTETASFWNWSPDFSRVVEAPSTRIRRIDNYAGSKMSKIVRRGLNQTLKNKLVKNDFVWPPQVTLNGQFNRRSWLLSFSDKSVSSNNHQNRNFLIRYVPF